MPVDETSLVEQIADTLARIARSLDVIADRLSGTLYVADADERRWRDPR